MADGQDSSPKNPIERIEDKQHELAMALAAVKEEGAERRVILEHAVEDIRKIDATLDGMRISMNEYNHQLTLHIAGVNELREANRLMRDSQAKVNAEQELRLSNLEKPYKWWDWTSSFLEKCGYFIAACAAIYGLVIFLANHVKLH